MLSVFFDGLCEPVKPGGVACYGFAVYSMSTIGESKVQLGGATEHRIWGQLTSTTLANSITRLWIWFEPFSHRPAHVE